MAHEVVWTKIILERFIELGNLTKEEEEIIRTRAAGWTRTQQAMKLDMSLSTVDRIIKNLKIKYDAVQKHDLILPKRKKSVYEDYMDNN